MLTLKCIHPERGARAFRFCNRNGNGDRRSSTSTSNTGLAYETFSFFIHFPVLSPIPFLFLFTSALPFASLSLSFINTFV